VRASVKACPSVLMDYSGAGTSMARYVLEPTQKPARGADASNGHSI